MQCQWLKRSAGASQVIVIFGGWGIGPDVFAHLETTADILYISDYRDLKTDLPPLDHYQERVLVAWSFGVASYCYWQKNHGDIFNRKVAINGSMIPIDRKLGIPPRVMQATIDSLSTASFQVFLTRCHGKPFPHQPLDITARKAELIAVQARDYTKAQQLWDRVWISRDDKIFPLANMQRAWPKTANILERPHVPFAAWHTWDEIIT